MLISRKMHVGDNSKAKALLKSSISMPLKILMLDDGHAIATSIKGGR